MNIKETIGENKQQQNDSKQFKVNLNFGNEVQDLK